MSGYLHRVLHVRRQCRCGSTGKRGCDRRSEEVSSRGAEESIEVVGPEIDAR